MHYATQSLKYETLMTPIVVGAARAALEGKSTNLMISTRDSIRIVQHQIAARFARWIMHIHGVKSIKPEVLLAPCLLTDTQ